MPEAMMDAIDPVRLDNQLCFPLYAAAKEVVRLYAPLLGEIDLTYTQYIAMMVLWQERELTVKEMGRRLFLDAGTLSPMLKKMEQRGLLRRTRDPEDERSVLLTVTEAGMALRNRAEAIPGKIRPRVPLTEDEARLLYRLLYKILDSLKEDPHESL
jgi:DNA-binding MarR family transcriptional regulator